MPKPLDPSDHSRLRVMHSTIYDYGMPVSLSYNKAWLKPSDTTFQHCEQHHLRVNPRPSFNNEQNDTFGNQLRYFEITSPHETFEVVAESVVRVRPIKWEELGQMPWESARYAALKHVAHRVRAAHYAFSTPMTTGTDEMVAWARESFLPGRSLYEAAFDLSARIFAEFHYQSGVTAVDTPLGEVWENRAGVCQDFAHLTLAMLRGLGLPCCYVSGYLLTDPPEGKEKVYGADASHAWFGVMDASSHWLFIDPTNDQWINNRYITVALGRDYTDVPPLKGVCYGGGAGVPKVAVNVDSLPIREALNGR